jgi:4-carboxymuconolactone decarboxylase
MVGISLSYEERFMSAAKTPPSVIGQVRGVFPKLGELTDKVVFGDVWERKGLSKRDRSLITVAALIALHRPEQLRFHLGRALENGVKKDELVETITHLAFYSGWPNAMSAISVAKEVL